MISMQDVREAAERLAGVTHRTPVVTSRTLNDRAGCEAYLKCENLQRVGAFKIRGAYNAISRLDQDSLARGVLAYSSGNHAQAVALSCRLLGSRAVIVMPDDAPAAKRAATEGYGAEIVTYSRAGENREELGRRLAEERGLTNIRFRQADAQRLALPDGSFDVVHSHQVLQHLGDPVAALREMRRVCAPGGVVAARDCDYAAMTWYPQTDGLDAWLALYRRVARASGGEPDAGRRLAAWARRAGFTDVTASASAWCFATDEERAWWSGLWAERTTASRYARLAAGGGHATEADLARIAGAAPSAAGRAGSLPAGAATACQRRARQSSAPPGEGPVGRIVNPSPSPRTD